jgi:Antitoxin Xre/MbcA/ParS C-terminal toxin-binding domain
MKASTEALTIAIVTSKLRDRGVSWPRDWDVRRGNSQEVLHVRPRPSVVVTPFVRRPTDTQIKEVARKFGPLLDESLSKLVVLCRHCNQRTLDSARLQRWVTAFRSPEQVMFTTNWDGVLLRIRESIAKGTVQRTERPMPVPRQSAFDKIAAVVDAGGNLRTASGRLSAEPIAKLFGISKSELARLVDRSPQALWKTPDAEALQNQLGYFEKIARLRLVLRDETRFRRWLRTANPSLSGKTPLDVIREKKWQIVADLVDDILAGTPS